MFRFLCGKWFQFVLCDLRGEDQNRTVEDFWAIDFNSVAGSTLTARSLKTVSKCFRGP